MKIPLNEVTIKSERVLSRLKQYLDYVGNWHGFDVRQLLHVYVNSDKDFCAFESRSHNINFMSNEHKFAEVIYSQYEVPDVSYQEFRSYVASL